MDKKNKIIGVLAAGFVLMNMNVMVANAEENDNSIKENEDSENTAIENQELLSNQNNKNLPIESESKTSKDVIFDGKYDTLEEAEAKKEEKEAEYKKDGYEDIKSEIVTIEDKEGQQVFDHYDIEVTTDAYTGISKEEADALKIELEKDDNVTVVIKYAGEVFDHNETTDFSKEFETEDEALAFIKSLEDEGYTLSEIKYTYNTETGQATLSETFNSLEDAKNALDAFKNQYENVNETYDDIVEARDESNDTEVSGSEQTSGYFDTEAEATSDMNSVISAGETHDYYITGTVIGPEETGEEELKSTENVVDEAFDSEEAANAYLDELKSNGYTIESLVITHDTGSETGTLSKTCETYEEAEAALNSFKNEYTVTSEGITEVADSSEDITDTYSKDFEDESEADSYKTSEEAKTTEKIVYTAEKVVNATETEELNEVYETLEEAEAAIREFENNHDVLDSESSVTERSAGTIYSSIVITKDMKTYEVGSTSYIIIKHGNENVVWTEKELTEEEQNTFIESYKDHQDNVITYNKLKQSHVFVSGYGENNYSGNGKLFMFYEEDGKTYIKLSSGAESRVIAGTFQPVNEYVATASGHNVSYTVNVTKVTKGYDYKVEATGSKDITLDSVKISYTKKLYGPKMGYKHTTKKYKKAYTYTINATGEETITLSSGTVSGKKTKAINKDIYNLDVSVKQPVYKTVFDDDYELLITGVMKEHKTENKIENPQTGDNVLYSFMLMLISSICIFYSSLRLRFFKEEN